MASEATRDEKYERYIRSDTWKKRRHKALNRAEHRCQVCYSKKRLDVHHRTYRRFENERDADLTVLCRRCHDLFHDHKRQERERAEVGKPKKQPNPNHVRQARQIKKKRKWQKRAAKRYAERPSTTARRSELAAQVLKEQREQEAA